MSDEGEFKMSSSYKLKVLLCGPVGCGKKDLIMPYIKSNFQDDTLTSNIDILTKDVKLANSSICTLSIWDIQGQERLSYIRSTLYKGAAGAILVFDLTRKATWDEVKKYREEVKQFAGDIPFLLIGNNVDKLETSDNVVDRDECRQYAEHQGLFYIETSFKDSRNVEEGISKLVNKIAGS